MMVKTFSKLCVVSGYSTGSMFHSLLAFEMFQNALQSVVDDRGILFSVFCASARGWSSMSAINKCSSNLFIEAY